MGRIASGMLIGVFALPVRFASEQAIAGGAPVRALPPPDGDAVCATLDQSVMIHVFDTEAMGTVPTYVNDHTIVQGPDGAWHLFGIFHREPMGPDTETDFVHAVSLEPDPAKWEAGAFVAAEQPFAIALRADPSLGETHLWAPHVVAAEGRWVMIYQGGGEGDDRASIRLAESNDLYRWTRVTGVPAFEDFCAARDPMLGRRDGMWILHYTRCDSLTTKISGVALRSSHDLIHFSEPTMVAVMDSSPATSNSAFTESPFVFERGGYHYLSVTVYPLAWDATLVYRSRAPFAFPAEPFTRLRAHAAEWIFGSGGAVFLTHAGPGQRGVWLSRVSGI